MNSSKRKSSKRKRDSDKHSLKKQKFNEQVAKDKTKVEEHVEKNGIRKNKVFGFNDEKRNKFVIKQLKSGKLKKSLMKIKCKQTARRRLKLVEKMAKFVKENTHKGKRRILYTANMGFNSGNDDQNTNKVKKDINWISKITGIPDEYLGIYNSSSRALAVEDLRITDLKTNQVRDFSLQDFAIPIPGSLRNTNIDAEIQGIILTESESFLKSINSCS